MMLTFFFNCASFFMKPLLCTRVAAESRKSETEKVNGSVKPVIDINDPW